LVLPVEVVGTQVVVGHLVPERPSLLHFHAPGSAQPMGNSQETNWVQSFQRDTGVGESELHATAVRGTVSSMLVDAAHGNSPRPAGAGPPPLPRA
jgi:hypothetical protein